MKRFRPLSAYSDYNAKFLGGLRREHKGPFDGYQNKLDRPKLTINASLYWSDVYLQLVSEDLDEGSEKATLKSLNSLRKTSRCLTITLKQ